jgi:septum formation protein
MLVKLPIPEIVLASTSPRRKLLLERIGLPHSVIVPSADEVVPHHGNCKKIALHNARIKAESVISKANGRAVIGVDTIVDLDGEPLGKPVDAIEAVTMISRLSGRDHFVHTAVYFVESDANLSYEIVETSLVHFRNLGASEIEAYVATGEPLDKAGAYGIQERGSMLVERIEGCFFNVMGLPVARLWKVVLQWLNDRGTPLDGW